MITVLFFARYRELLGCDRLQLAPADCPPTLFALRNMLADKGQPWQEVMASHQGLMALNQVMTRQDSPLHDGDEVAFFPPVTGG